ncbi:TIGR04211 family SH3 domain-containing protein [Arsukibacterium sp.]|uniref:TIGR04211 family SH3 domain-containing protein n=1 Tax=Arsukibacterium sp. TaxID=1977258 RepID=UPI002FD97E93
MFSIVRSTLLTLFLFSALFGSGMIQANERPAFISDALFVYLHSGPGNQYRIVGTINAGTDVTFVSEDSGYAQIRYDGNKTGWLPKEHVTFNPGLVSQLQHLNSRYNEQQQQLLQLEQLRDGLQNQLRTALAERDNALTELQQVSRTNERLSTELDATQSSFWQNPMVLGAGILVLGLFFGLVLPLVWPKRRGGDRWM